MARITVEDCIEVVKNRFELVLLAAQRAKAISSGSHILVDRDNDKNAVVALREIGDKKLNAEVLRETLIEQNQKRLPRGVVLDDGDEVTEIDTDLAIEISKELSDEISGIDSDESASSLGLTMEDGTSFGDDNMDVED